VTWAVAIRVARADETNRIRPIVDRIFPLEEVTDAHRLMESSIHFGKMGLRLNQMGERKGRM
jgi:NADPH:quinone reductase-like Zn-dependent oxidoreductase